VTQETSTLGPTRDYAYDDASQLTSDGTDDWSFDQNGNRTMAGYETDDGNRLISDGVSDYVYDDEGNVVQRIDGTTGELWVHTYNHLNQLTKAEHLPDEWSNADLRVEYKYDIFGNRIERSVDDDGDGENVPVAERFAYDQNSNAWADLDDSNAITTRRLYLDTVDALFARIDSEGDVAWYLTDRLGSIRDLMDTDGTVLDHIDYNGFGKITYESDPGSGDRYTWTGRELDDVTGLQFNRARWYSFDIVGWMSVDPIGFAAGDTNLYRYVGNSPTSATDPSGLAAEGQVRAAYRDSTNLTIHYGITNGRQFTDAQIQQMFDQVEQMSSAPDNHEPNPLYNDWIARFSNGVGTAYDFGRGFVAGVGSQAWGIITGLAEMVASPVQTLTAFGQFVGQLASNLWDGEFDRAFRQLFPDVHRLVTQWGNLSDYERGHLSGRVTVQIGLMVSSAALLISRIRSMIPRRTTPSPLSPAPAQLAPTGCFPAGTPIRTPHGSKPIELIKPGDLVLSRWEYDPNGPVETKIAQELVVRVSVLLNVHVSGQVIRATPEHPFFVEGRGWTGAAFLESGDRLHTLEGDFRVVEAVTDAGEVATVYNFPVADYRTYFLGTDAWGFALWTHNPGSCSAPTTGHPPEVNLTEQPWGNRVPPGAPLDMPTPPAPPTMHVPGGPPPVLPPAPLTGGSSTVPLGGSGIGPGGSSVNLGAGPRPPATLPPCPPGWTYDPFINNWVPPRPPHGPIDPSIDVIY
jgi:RHS repeat-associated protein